jgi:hypothetical protein
MEGEPTDTVINFGEADIATWNRNMWKGIAWVRMKFLRAANGCKKGT